MRTIDLDRVLPAGAFFAAAVMLHNADHVRRGADAVEADVFWLGTLAVVFEVALVVLICQRHRAAPLIAAAGGFTLAAGYLLVHFLPGRGWLSDPLLAQNSSDAWSIGAASVETIAALVLGLVGLAAVSRLGGLVGATQANMRQRTLREAVLHPVAATFALSQVVTLAVSFAQL